MHLAAGDTERGVAASRQALASAQAAYELLTDDDEAHARLVAAQSYLGAVLYVNGRLQEAIEVLEAAVAAVPSTSTNELASVEGCKAIGLLHAMCAIQVHHTEALTRAKAGVTIDEYLVATDSQNIAWSRHLTISYDLVGDCHRDRSELSEAMGAYEEALTIREELVRRIPTGWKCCAA